MDDFLIRAALAGLGVAVAAAPLGCFVVWRRIAYFGDATAHAALLGVALALALSWSVTLGVAAVALAMAYALSRSTGRETGADATLGVMAHGGLAFGLIGAAMATGGGADLEAWLFGDILAVDRAGLWTIWGGAAVVSLLILTRWSGLILATLSPGLAIADGIDPRREALVLNIALALTVAVAIQVVGALLITGLLIAPAVAARPFARGPEAMALGALIVGAGAVGLGLWASWTFDAPAGPAIIAAATLAALIARLLAKLRP